ncbi:hypothetical protein DIPPA_05948 [Diplonema papillatum]|nr:hypothetical protein DIPPA_05948 [Diplonema papillatum]
MRGLFAFLYVTGALGLVEAARCFDAESGVFVTPELCPQHCCIGETCGTLAECPPPSESVSTSGSWSLLSVFLVILLGCVVLGCIGGFVLVGVVCCARRSAPAMREEPPYHPAAYTQCAGAIPKEDFVQGVPVVVTTAPKTL